MNVNTKYVCVSQTGGGTCLHGDFDLSDGLPVEWTENGQIRVGRRLKEEHRVGVHLQIGGGDVAMRRGEDDAQRGALDEGLSDDVHLLTAIDGSVSFVQCAKLNALCKSNEVSSVIIK